MTRIASSLIAIPAVALAVFGGRAISAQDKYTVEVPGGLAFSEFRGYEDWSVVAMSENNGAFAVILGNPSRSPPLGKACPAMASLSQMVPSWRKSIGSRRNRKRILVRQWCRVPI
jgi:hypothetical protein